MNVQLNQLVKSLLDKESIEQCSLQEVEQYAHRHPYFGAAQLLFTKKLQLEKHEKYEEQLQKTFLFFHNPLWVEHLLNENGGAEIIAPPVKTGTRKETEAVAADNSIPTAPEAIIAPVSLAAATLVQEEIKQEPATPVKEEKQETPSAAPVKEASGDLLFEPYHTIDYFASQGIRFREEEKPADKFGQQLKSFTDWLKTMRKLPVSEISKTVEAVTEKKVEQMAEQSLSEKEVLTESMAEVWIKQGNPAKAIEVYSKLSLLEPSKSTYFAAKIEALQKQT